MTAWERLFWCLVVVVVYPMALYLSAKLVTYGWLMGRRKFYQDYPSQERKDGQA